LRPQANIYTPESRGRNGRNGRAGVHVRRVSVSLLARNETETLV